MASSSPQEPLRYCCCAKNRAKLGCFWPKGFPLNFLEPPVCARAVFTAQCDRQCGLNFSEHFNSPRQVRSGSCLLLQVRERCFSAFLKKCSQPHVWQSSCLEWQLCFQLCFLRALFCSLPAGITLCAKASREGILSQGTKRSSTLDLELSRCSKHIPWRGV